MSEHDDEQAVGQALNGLRDKLREAGLQPYDMETANEELIDEIKELIEEAKEEARKRTEIAIFEATRREASLSRRVLRCRGSAGSGWQGPERSD